MHEQFRGIIPYLVSPINGDGSVRREVLAGLIDHLLKTGVHGITVLGSAGEYPLLDADQKREIVRTAAESCAGRAPMIAGVSGASVRSARAAAGEYVGLGAAGIVAMLEMFYPLSESQIADFYIGIATEVPDTPIVIYSNPKYMHFDLPLGVFERLEPYPNIRYYKDASGDTGKLLTFKRRFGDRYDLFSASAHIPLFVMMLGGLGWMSGPACLFPARSIELYDLAVAGRYGEAMRLQERLWEANRVFKKYDMAACLKCGLAHQGFDVGDPIPPLEGLRDAAAAEVYDLVDRLFEE